MKRGELRAAIIEALRCCRVAQHKRPCDTCNYHTKHDKRTCTAFKQASRAAHNIMPLIDKYVANRGGRGTPQAGAAQPANQIGGIIKNGK